MNFNTADERCLSAISKYVFNELCYVIIIAKCQKHHFIHRFDNKNHNFRKEFNRI